MAETAEHPRVNPDADPVTPRPARRRRARTGPEVRERRRRLIRYGLLAVSALLMVNALIGEKGYLATIQARREHDALEASLRALRSENARLAEEARRLKEDPKALEEAARRDLGLIRPGETLITVRDRTSER